MKSAILITTLLVFASCFGDQPDEKDLNCSLNITTGPGALKIVQAAEGVGATDLSDSSEGLDIGEHAGPIEIILCSEVIEISENTLPQEIALDFTRLGYFHNYRVRPGY